MTAQGIQCVCIDEHFSEMKSAGVYKNGYHVNATPLAVAYQMRMLLLALNVVKQAYTPWCAKEEMQDGGYLRERTVEAAATSLGLSTDYMICALEEAREVMRLSVHKAIEAPMSFEARQIMSDRAVWSASSRPVQSVVEQPLPVNEWLGSTPSMVETHVTPYC